MPPNGLVIYCGTIITDEGKEKKVNIDFEPFKPINTSLYLCDNKFHTEALKELLESDEKFGFIVMDGNGFHLLKRPLLTCIRYTVWNPFGKHSHCPSQVFG